MNFYNKVKKELIAGKQKIVKQYYCINKQIAVNRKALTAGTVLNPASHPSYSEKTIAAIKMANDSKAAKLENIQDIYERDIRKALSY